MSFFIPFPFTNQTRSKKRPAVIISSKTYNQSHPDRDNEMSMTSNLNGAAVALKDWQTAGPAQRDRFQVSYIHSRRWLDHSKVRENFDRG